MQCVNGNEFTKISLEDFITFVKQGGVGATGIDTKRAGSHSFEANCCVSLKTLHKSLVIDALLIHHNMLHLCTSVLSKAHLKRA